MPIKLIDSGARRRPADAGAPPGASGPVSPRVEDRAPWRFEVLKAERLRDSVSSDWLQAQAGEASWDSPLLRPEFVSAVAAYLPGTRVAVAISERGARAFWPFEEVAKGVARPVGGKLGCLHGIVAAPGFAVDPLAMVRGAGMKRWHFDHLLVAPPGLAPGGYGAHVFETQEAPYLDLSGGFERYLQRRKEQGHSNRNIEGALGKMRRLRRVEGDCVFETGCRDASVIRTLVGWKRAQMRETGHRDLFVTSPWIEPFAAETLSRRQDSFRGMLCALRVCGEPVALLYGLRSGAVLHGLVLGYDPRFSRYSPGVVLLVELARRANEIGLRRIELGKGREFYKQTLKSGSHPLGVGVVCEPGPTRALLRASCRLRSAAGSSRFGPVLKSSLGRLQRTGDLYQSKRPGGAKPPR